VLPVVAGRAPLHAERPAEEQVSGDAKCFETVPPEFRVLLTRGANFGRRNEKSGVCRVGFVARGPGHDVRLVWAFAASVTRATEGEELGAPRGRVCLIR
jgi:hypothetical protein